MSRDLESRDKNHATIDTKKGERSSPGADAVFKTMAASTEVTPKGKAPHRQPAGVRGQTRGSPATHKQSPRKKKKKSDIPDYAYQRVREGTRQGTQSGRIHSFRVEVHARTPEEAKLKRYCPEVSPVVLTKDAVDEGKCFPPQDANPHFVSNMMRLSQSVAVLRKCLALCPSKQTLRVLWHDAIYGRFQSLLKNFIAPLPGLLGSSDERGEEVEHFPGSLRVYPRYACLTPKDQEQNARCGGVAELNEVIDTCEFDVGVLLDNYHLGYGPEGDVELNPANIHALMCRHSHRYLVLSVHPHLGDAGHLYGEGYWLRDPVDGKIQPYPHKAGTGYGKHPSLCADLLVPGKFDADPDGEGTGISWSVELKNAYGYATVVFSRVPLGQLRHMKVGVTEPPAGQFRHKRLRLVNSDSPLIRGLERHSYALPNFLRNPILDWLTHEEYRLVDVTTARAIVAERIYKRTNAYSMETYHSFLEKHISLDPTWIALEEAGLKPSTVVNTSAYLVQLAAKTGPGLTSLATSVEEGLALKNEALRRLSSPSSPDYRLAYAVALGGGVSVILALTLAWQLRWYLSWISAALQIMALLGAVIYGGPHVVSALRQEGHLERLSAWVSQTVSKLRTRSGAARFESFVDRREHYHSLEMFPFAGAWFSACWEELAKWALPWTALVFGIVEGARRRDHTSTWIVRIGAHVGLWALGALTTVLLAMAVHALWNWIQKTEFVPTEYTETVKYDFGRSMTRAKCEVRERAVDARAALYNRLARYNHVRPTAPSFTPCSVSLHPKTGAIGTGDFLHNIVGAYTHVVDTLLPAQWKAKFKPKVLRNVKVPDQKFLSIVSTEAPFVMVGNNVHTQLSVITQRLMKPRPAVRWKEETPGELEETWVHFVVQALMAHQTLQLLAGRFPSGVGSIWQERFGTNAIFAALCDKYEAVAKEYAMLTVQWQSDQLTRKPDHIEGVEALAAYKEVMLPSKIKHYEAEAQKLGVEAGPDTGFAVKQALRDQGRGVAIFTKTESLGKVEDPEQPVDGFQPRSKPRPVHISPAAANLVLGPCVIHTKHSFRFCDPTYIATGEYEGPIRVVLQGDFGYVEINVTLSPNANSQAMTEWLKGVSTGSANGHFYALDVSSYDATYLIMLLATMTDWHEHEGWPAGAVDLDAYMCTMPMTFRSAGRAFLTMSLDIGPPAALFHTGKPSTSLDHTMHTPTFTLTAVRCCVDDEFGSWLESLAPQCKREFHLVSGPVRVDYQGGGDDQQMYLAGIPPETFQAALAFVSQVLHVKLTGGLRTLATLDFFHYAYFPGLLASGEHIEVACRLPGALIKTGLCKKDSFDFLGKPLLQKAEAAGISPGELYLLLQARCADTEFYCPLLDHYYATARRRYNLMADPDECLTPTLERELLGWKFQAKDNSGYKASLLAQGLVFDLEQVRSRLIERYNFNGDEIQQLETLEPMPGHHTGSLWAKLAQDYG